MVLDFLSTETPLALSFTLLHWGHFQMKMVQLLEHCHAYQCHITNQSNQEEGGTYDNNTVNIGRKETHPSLTTQLFLI